jgi:hypothetical protein
MPNPANLEILELDAFFMQTGRIYQTLQHLTQSLEREGIDYAIVGGMALVLHGYTRATQDVDVLLTQEGLERFREALVGRGFTPAFSGAKRMFKDSQTGVTVEFLVSGEFPGDGKPKAVSFPIPTAAATQIGEIQVIQLENLVELKLASGLSGSDRLKDLADVQELIRNLNLPQDFAQQLDPSVQQGYLQLWDGVERARQNQTDWEQ